MHVSQNVIQVGNPCNLRNRLSISEASDYFQNILFKDILPLWSTIGIDHSVGGFCESIGLDGRAPHVARRVRVSARQIYAFSEAARLGFNFTAASFCAMHGYRFLKENSSSDGLIYHSITHDGACLDAGYDLYDQAFLLLALASAYRHLGDERFRADALDLLQSLRKYFSHVKGGFIDRTDRPIPLRANPHMHLFEAALAWMAVDCNPAWRHLADEIVDLFLAHFFDASKGVVREVFNADWEALEDGGRCRVEPGHHYEWAWLLLRWERLTGAGAGDAPWAMIDFAETHGYDADRHVTVNECWNDGLPLDRTARLWPQTERLKAWLAIAENLGGVAKFHAEAKALDAARTLIVYLNGEQRGIWRDLMMEDGTFKESAAPASSFYHIMCALGELATYATRMDHNDVAIKPLPTSKLADDVAVELSI